MIIFYVYNKVGSYRPDDKKMQTNLVPDFAASGLLESFDKV